MESSETPIQPGRSGSDKSAPPSSFQGTVTALKRENGVQTVEIQSAQGKIKLQAEGEFQVGERLRVVMPPGGSIRLEKAPLPSGQPDWQGVSYQMNGNVTTLKSVRAFEEQLVNWVGSRQPGSPMAGKGGPGLPGGGSELESLLRLPLPELLKRVLAREGGRDMLMQALSALSKENFSSLMAGLEEGRSDGAKASLLAMLRSMRREVEPGNLSPPMAKGMEGMSGGARGAAAMEAKNMGAFWPGKEGASPWMGRVLDRQDSGGALAFAGGKPLPYMPKGPGAGPTADLPMFRYLIDLGGRTLEVQSPQKRQVGEFVEFEMENQGTRMQAKLLDPAQALPQSLRAGFAQAPADAKAALQVTARYLAEFKGEPYFDKLVKDFGEVLAQGGRFAAPEGGHPIKAGNLPNQKELDNILRLFVAFPRDKEQPERQAKAWTEAFRDPKAMMDLLKSLKTESDTSLLRTGTPLRLASGMTLPPDFAGAALPEGEDRAEDALVALLRKVLPDGFKSTELLELARNNAAAGSPESRSAQGGPDAKAAQFLLQAFAGLVPREDELREGRPNQFYFYQNQDWKGLQITWERERDSKSKGKRDISAPVKVRVETQAQHMGKVDVGVVLTGNRATLDFRNQFHDVRELLAENIPELKKSLAILDVHIEAWTYDRMAQDQPHIPPTAGWVRPASLDGGNLDLMG